MAPKLFCWLRPASSRQRKLITKSEVARVFGVSTRTIDIWLKNGKLPKGERRFGLQRWDYEKIAALRKH